MAKAAEPPPFKPITRDDIEGRLRTIKDGVDKRRENAQSKLVPFAVGGGILLLLLTYLIGKRVGKTRSTVVEIRRI